MLDEEGENGVGKTFLMFGVWRMVNWTLYSLKWWKLFYVEEKNKKHIYLSLLFWKNRNFTPYFEIQYIIIQVLFSLHQRGLV
jgi:hypothetical protein